MNALRYYTALLVIVASVVGSVYVVYSCIGGGYDERSRISYVDPDLFSDSIYHSLYRTLLHDHQMNADEFFFEPHGEFLNWEFEGEQKIEENVRDWNRYFRGTLPPSAISSLLYDTSDSLLQFVRSQLQEGRQANIVDVALEPRNVWDDPTSHRKESGTTDYARAFDWMFRRKDVELADYLVYMKACESVASDYHSKEIRDSLVAEGIARHRDSRSPFLRMRYAFQVVRLARYNYDFERAISLYDSLIASDLYESSVRYWALHHVAGAQIRLGDSIGADYTISRVFDNSDGEREVTVREFKGHRPERWKKVYALAQNNHERSILWMLWGFKQDGLDFSYLRRMYELEPNSRYLSLALMRELHRIEFYLYASREMQDICRPPFQKTWDTLVVRKGATDWIDRLRYEHDYTSWLPLRFDVRYVPGRPYINEFRSFVLDHARTGDVWEPGLWYMVAGYIDLMDGESGMADDCLEMAASAGSGSNDLMEQIELLRNLQAIQKRGTGAAGFESNVASTLRWLREKQKKNDHTKFNRVMSRIAQQYLIDNDVPKAVLAFNLADEKDHRNELIDIYAGHHDLDELIRLVESGGSTPLEQMMIDSFPFHRPELTDFQATRYMRDGDFRTALELYETIPEAYWDLPPLDTVGYWPARDLLFARFSSDETAGSFGGHTLDEWKSNNRYGNWDRTSADSLLQHLESFSPRRIFTRRDFARRVVQLLDSARTDRIHQDSILFRIGNILFHTPYWQYNAVLWRGSLMWHWGSWNDYASFYSYPYNTPELAERAVMANHLFALSYGSREPARRFYQEVIKITPDRELAARCAYLLDLSANTWMTSDRKRMEQDSPPDRSGYNLLMSHYYDTQTARSILSQCSTYQSYQLESIPLNWLGFRAGNNTP